MTFHLENQRIPNKETLFQGKNVVITGGASGIGNELAKQFQRLGANVQIIDKANVELQENVTFLQADVTDKEQLQTKFTDQKIDILIVAAGVTSQSNDPTQEEQALMVAVNVHGVQNTLEAFASHLTSESQIIYIGSDNPRKDFYRETKSRGAQIVRDFATKHLQQKIKLILLGPVITPLFEKGKTKEEIAGIEQRVGIYEPAEFANELIAKLLEPDSRGTNLEEFTMYKQLSTQK